MEGFLRVTQISRKRSDDDDSGGVVIILNDATAAHSKLDVV